MGEVRERISRAGIASAAHHNHMRWNTPNARMVAVIQTSIMPYTRKHNSNTLAYGHRYALHHGMDSVDAVMSLMHHQASNNAAMRSHAARIEASRAFQKNEAYSKYMNAVKMIDKRHDRQLSHLSTSTYCHALY